MALKDLFATKSLELLHEEMKGENRLRRVLGPVGLTSLGVGAIIGAGIFVITGRVAANDAGPGVLISYAVAGLAHLRHNGQERHSARFLQHISELRLIPQTLR